MISRSKLSAALAGGLAAALLLQCAASLSGCGAATVREPVGQGFPPPAGLHPRQFSDGAGRYHGDSYADPLPSLNVAVEGPALNFLPDPEQPGLAGCAYAIHYLPVDDPAAGGELRLGFEWWVEPVYGEIYCGVGNRGSAAWEWHLIDSAEFVLSLDPDDDYVDGNGGLLVAIMALPDAGFASLSYFRLDSLSGGGWQHAELASFDGPQHDPPVQLGDVALIAGRPAIVYALSSGEPAQTRLQLARSATAAGAAAGDWTIHDLGELPADGTLMFSLAEIGGGYGIAWSWRNNEGAGAIHYLHALNPDSGEPNSGFSAATVFDSASVNVYWARLGEIAGAPGISFFSNADGTLQPHYAAGDAAGANWTLSKVSDNAYTFLNHTQSSITPPVQIDGAPAFAALCDAGDVTGVRFYKASGPVPDLQSDWTALDLGPAGEARTLDLAELNGNTVLSANSLFSNPQVCTMFELTGADALNAADWTMTVLDNIGVGFSSEVQVFALGAGLGIATGDSYGVSAPVTPFLGGTIRPQRLYRGGAIVNDSAQWSAETVIHDTNSGILRQVRFISNAGKPAFAALESITDGDGPLDTETTLRWRTFEP